MQKIYFFKRSKISSEILSVKKYLASFSLLLLTLLFSTSGNLVSAQTLNENFSGTTFPPAGWVSENVLGSNTWGRSTSQFRSAPSSAFINWQGTVGEDWLFTPSNSILSGDTIEFYFRRNLGTPYPPDSLILWSGSSQTVAGMDTVLARIDVANATNATWIRVAIPVGYAAGSSRVFGFQHKNTNGNGVFIDDVRLIKTPGFNCDFPFSITSLPFSQTGFNTGNFGNNITFSPCNQAYVNGDDMVFQFTAPGTGYSPVRIATGNSGTWIGLHVTSTCPQSANICNAYIGQSAVNPVLDAPLIGGQTYYLTVSSNPAPQAVPFDLTITPLNIDTIISAATGNWGDASTWIGGVLPTIGSTVLIDAGHTVTYNVAGTTSINHLTVSSGATLNFNAAAARILSLTGNLTINAGGTVTSVPTTGTSARTITLRGDLVNNGVLNLSGVATNTFTLNGVTPQTISGTGTFPGGVRLMNIENPMGITLNMPLTILGALNHRVGTFNTNGNITFENLATSTATVVTLTISPGATFVGNPNVGPSSTTIYVVSYARITNFPFGVSTTGDEIPANRTIGRLTLSNVDGVNLTGGDLFLNAAASALTLTNGRLNIPAGNKLATTNTAYTAFPGGSDASFINGTLQMAVSTTAAGSRTFPIGSNGFRRPVIFGAINTAGVTVDITANVEPTAPSGTSTLPLIQILGSRMYRVQAAGLPAATTITLAFGADDSLNLGNFNSLRVAQSATGTGSWNPISVATGTGSIPATGTRVSLPFDIANGEYFAFGTASGPDLEVFRLDTPTTSGCYSSTEPVVVTLRNRGTLIDFATSPTTVSGNIVGPNGTFSLQSAIINSGTLAANATISVSLGSQNLTAAGAYDFTLHTNSATDSVFTNDTLRVRRFSYTYFAETNPSTVLFGGIAQLIVKSDNNPALSTIRITEISPFRTGTGATSPYPSWIGAGDDLIEFTNTAGLPVDISGWVLDIFGIGARTYTFPTGAIVPANGVIVVHVGAGTDNPTAGFFNTGGSSNVIQSASATGFVLRNPSLLIVDAVAINSYVFPVASGVTSVDWSGNIPSSSGAGSIILNGPDLNSATNWVISTANNLGSFGTVNPAFSIPTPSSPTISWTGPGGFTGNGNSINSNSLTILGNNNFIATITGAPGCSTTAIATVNVQTPTIPVANFGINSVLGTTQTIFTLTDSSTNIPTGWKWSVAPNTVNFVNGTTDSTQNPQVQFTAAGTYSITLIASNPAGSDTITQTNLVTVQLGYCVSGSTNIGDTKIDSVSFAGISTGTSPTACESYTLNTTNLGSVVKGAAYPFTVRNGSCSGTHYSSITKIYIDWNGDGDFTDVGEEVYVSAVSTAIGNNIGSITVPANAITGSVGMRIITRETTVPADITSCGLYPWGETEDYFINISPNPIGNFTLLTPPNNTSITVSAASVANANISWTSASAPAAVTYAWVAAPATGNINSPVLTIPANNSGSDTILTLPFSAIDAAVAGLGVGFGDTANVIWSVIATSNGISKLADTVYNLRIIRAVPPAGLSAFTLIGPPNNASILIGGVQGAIANINWTRSNIQGATPTYEWIAAPATGAFTPLVTIPSNNGGVDSVLRLSFFDINNLLASLGVAVGDSATVRWTVRATSGTLTRSATDTFTITLRRGTFAPLLVTPMNAPVGGPSALGRAPITQNNFHRSSAVYKASEFVGVINSGQQIYSIGYQITAAATAAVTGNIKIWMVNTPDSSFLRSTIWDTLLALPVAMQQVYDGPLTINPTTGVYNIPFQNAFNYSGGGVYVAFEWNIPGVVSTSASYACNSTGVVNGQRNVQGNVSFGATLSQASSFRPYVSWGVSRLANDLAVTNTYVLGTAAQGITGPTPIRVRVRNDGALTATNRTVTVNVSGANTFSGTANIASLALDSITIVTVNGFTPTNLGDNIVTASVANDDNNLNNSRSALQLVRVNRLGHADSTTATGAVGFNAASGLLLQRHRVSVPRQITQVNMVIGSGVANIGKSVYAVVTNDTGAIIAQSAPFVIDTPSLNNFRTFQLITPVIIPANTVFFVGMAQPASTPGYFPLGFSTETPIRDTSIYTAPLAGGVAPVVSTGTFLTKVEAVMSPLPPDTLSAFTLVSPANNSTVVGVPGSSTPVNITWNRSNRSVQLPGNAPVTYNWVIDLPGGNFTTPIATIAANNGGLDTALTLTLGQVDALLAANNVLPGGSVVAIWSVRATSNALNRLASVPFNITLTRSSIPDTLSNFALLGPANNTTLTVTQGNTTPVNINWRRSARSQSGPAVTYEWLVDVPAGTFATPLATIPANSAGVDSVLTLTQNQIDALLASNGVAFGGTIALKWTVRATSGNLNKLAVAPFNITLTRGIPDTLSAFNLLSPPNNTRIVVEGDGNAPVNITWSASVRPNAAGVTYAWIADPAGNFTTPLVSLPSNNSGADAGLTLTVAQVNALLVTNNIAIGDSVTLQWTVRATATGATPALTRLANQTFSIKLVRGIITNVSDLNLSNALQLFPNPASEQTRIVYTFEKPTDLVTEILDVQGKLVQTRSDRGLTNGSIDLNLENLQSGVYFIHFTSADRFTVKRLVIQK